MNMESLGIAAALVALFATGASPATSVRGGGCCPFCN